MTPDFDPLPLRQQFPSLNQRFAGHRMIFLDGPGGTQTPEGVIEAMGDYLRHNNSNLGGAFATSRTTDEVAHSTRLAVTDFFNARSPEEIIFGQNMTSLTMAVSRAIARTWVEGDEIIVTNLDHDANITPWTLAAAERGVKVNTLDFDPQDCTLRIQDLPGMINQRTRLVAVTLASNAVGSIVDVARISEIAHEVDALVYVDAVHYAPHAPIDVKALGCDFLAASAYKFFGPHVGLLYGRYELLDALEAYKVRPADDKPPGKWETGTQNFEGLAGVRAALSYLENVGRQFGQPEDGPDIGILSRRQRLRAAMEAIKRYEEGLALHFLQKAPSIPGLRVFGISDIERLAERVPTFAVSLENLTPREVAVRLGDQGIFVWDGHYYAIAVMEQLGLLKKGGLIRIGFVHYNTIEEVDRLIDALNRLSAN